MKYENMYEKSFGITTVLTNWMKLNSVLESGYLNLFSPVYNILPANENCEFLKRLSFENSNYNIDSCKNLELINYRHYTCSYLRFQDK